VSPGSPRTLEFPLQQPTLSNTASPVLFHLRLVQASAERRIRRGTIRVREGAEA
jgi:hypothetical protein